LGTTFCHDLISIAVDVVVDTVIIVVAIVANAAAFIAPIDLL